MSAAASRPPTLGRLAGAGGLALAGALVVGSGGLLPVSAQEAAQLVPSGGRELRRPAPASYADVLEPALQSVVHVVSARSTRGGAARSPFGWFFGGPDGEGRQAPERENQGSGVIVRSDGVIVTNYHVVQDADEVVVTLADRRELVADVVGTDPPSDLAVLRVREKGLPALSFGDSRALRVGDLVFALGSPLGLTQTATMGIVSATNRGELGITRYDDLIQTDAAINPGNSGGPMLNARGEVVGINTAIIYRGVASFQGVGLAIPSEMVARVLSQILENGRVVRAYLGVSLDMDLDQAKADKLGLERPSGALVTQVVPDTPADRAGLRPGDVITAVEGEAVESSQSLKLAISGRRPGQRVKLRVLRDGDARTLTARLDEYLENDAGRRERQGPDPDAPRWGFRLQELSPELRKGLDLPADTQGVVVSDVVAGSAAARAGLRRGDVVLRIERQEVSDIEQADRLIRSASGDALLLLVRSGENTRFLVLER